MKKHFILNFKAGPAWIPGKPNSEQKYWNEHASFMENLFDKGLIIMSGTYANHAAVMIIVEAADESEIVNIFKNDPFILKSIFVLDNIIEWEVSLDAHKKTIDIS